ncbi:MAG: alpha-galactosidase [Polyangia bacterium]|jgi:hypothetical protein|nr:alpha-galactosidase [Polyangia bacterium]
MTANELWILGARRVVPALLVLSCAGVLAGACSDDDDDTARRCEPVALSVQAEGVRLTDSCGEVDGLLLPEVRIGGEWLRGGAGGACEVEADRLSCPLPPVGRLVAVIEAGDLRVELQATSDATVQGLLLGGEVVVPGATSWLSSGFQSWSQSGMIALGAPLAEGVLESALMARGDPETLRTGRELSWFHTWIGGPSAFGATLFAGAMTSERWKTWVTASLSGEAAEVVTIRLGSGGAGEEVAVLAGATLRGESWRLRAGTTWEEALMDYGGALPSRRTDHPAAAEAGWNSWYDLWDGVDEAAVRANAALAAEILGPLVPAGTPLRITVDDGWQEAWGSWEPNEKFPSGLDGLAADLHADGFEVGVWLAPLLVTEDSSLVQEHPEWFVGDAFYNHSKNGRMAVLDPTHPGARAHLGGFISKIVGWGFDFLKIDFLFAGTFEGRRHEPVTGMEAYHLALETVREAAGPEVILLAVGAPGLPSLPHVDAWRVGPDIAFEPLGPSWFFAVNQARTIASRWPLCLATLCDPDPPLLRDLSASEVDYGAWVVALAGGGLFLSDDLRSLPVERRDWGLDADRVAGSLGGLPAVPLDPFPSNPPMSLTSHALDHLAGENHHVLPEEWRLPDGRVLRLNHSDEPVTAKGVVIPGRGARLLP